MNSFPEKKLSRAERSALKARVLGMQLPTNYVGLTTKLLPELDTPQGHRKIRQVRNLQTADALITDAFTRVQQEMQQLMDRLQMPLSAAGGS